MKYLQYIGFLALSLMIASCNSGSDVSDSSGSGSTEVAVTIGERSAGGSAAQGPELFPASVASFEFSVTGPNMSPLGQIVDLQPGQTSFTVIFIVPNGLNRCFAINALNAIGGLAYSGVSCVDINGGTPIVTVYMQQECALYVDVNTGVDTPDCTDSNNPCQTITYALTQTAGNEAICVAAGTYDDTNESFPLNLLPGTSLICQGAGYSTIIDDYPGTVINGAAGALIQGCQILGDPAIDDDSEITTVIDVLLDGNNSAYSGIILYADSIVMNSTLQNFDYSGIEINSGSPTITNNTITGTNYYPAIDSSTDGSPVISNNTITGTTDDDGIEISNGSPTITGNTITGSGDDGIDVWTTGSVVIRDNIITGSGDDGIEVGTTGSADITGNTITGNNYGVNIENNGNPVINSNILSCNTQVDLRNATSNAIDAQSNQWDNAPPTEVVGTCNLAGEDICNTGRGSVNFTGNTIAPLPCTP